MDSRWIGFFVFIWFIGTVMGLTYDGMNTASEWDTGGYVSGNTTKTISELKGANVAGQTLPILGTVKFLTPVVNFVKTLFNVIVWNFSFVQPYPFVRMIFNVFGIIGVLMVFRLLYSSVTGNVSWG